jgi:large-conductance mechanosensitive channel
VLPQIASILGGKPHYIHYGWFLISVANLVVIGLMILVFVLAIVLPFPGRPRRRPRR